MTIEDERGFNAFFNPFVGELASHIGYLAKIFFRAHRQFILQLDDAVGFVSDRPDPLLLIFRAYDAEQRDRPEFRSDTDVHAFKLFVVEQPRTNRCGDGHIVDPLPPRTFGTWRQDCSHYSDVVGYALHGFDRRRNRLGKFALHFVRNGAGQRNDSVGRSRVDIERTQMAVKEKRRFDLRGNRGVDRGLTHVVRGVLPLRSERHEHYRDSRYQARCM